MDAAEERCSVSVNQPCWLVLLYLQHKQPFGRRKCTGMYVREEDIFSAIYHQLKLYIQEQFISSMQYDGKMAQLKAKLDAQVEFRHAIAENPAMFYEQYILGEISLDEFKVKQQKLRQAAQNQKSDRA